MSVVRSWFRPLVLTATGLAIGLVPLAVRAADADRGVLVGHGDKLTAELGPDDPSDAFTCELGAGTKFSFGVKAAKGTGLTPTLRLLDPDGAVVDVGSSLRGAGGPKPQLKNFVVPESGTGVWTVLVDGNAGAGSYQTKVKLAPATKAGVKKAAVAAGATVLVPITARRGALLSVVVKAREGGIADIRVLDPDGGERAELADFVPKGATLRLSKLPLDGPFGTYVIEATATSSGPAVLDVKAAVKLPGRAARKVALGPEVRFDAVASTAVRQGVTGVQLALTGTSLVAGSRAEISGTGVHVASVALAGGTATLTLDVDADAPFGPRDVLWVPPVEVGEPVVVAAGLDVRAPVPAIDAATPAALRQGDVARVLDVHGSGFRAGGMLAVSGDGVALGPTTVVSSTLARVAVTVDDDAVLTARDVTYTQPAAGGGDSVTAAGLLPVRHPDPRLDSVAPVSVRQEDTGIELTLSGAGFRDGGSVDLGAGLTVTSTTFVGATTLRITVDVASDATTGARAVTYTQPAVGGGASDTLASGLRVDAPVPTITSAAPGSILQGGDGQSLTLTGTGFRAGAVITVLGDGITHGATTVDSATSATVLVDVARFADVGLRDVRITQSAAGGGASTTVSDLVRVAHPTPVLATASPAILQGAGATDVTLTGSGLRDGGTVAVSGSGVTVGAVTWLSDTQARVTLTAAPDATLVARDVTWTQAAVGGGASGTGVGILQVHAPDPTLASISPAVITQGQSGVEVTLTGTGFRAGGTVIVAGVDVTPSAFTFVSDTSFRVTLAATSGAPLGPRDVTYRHADAVGGSEATLADALAVNAPTPTVTSIAPTILRQGAVGQTLTVTGTGFRTGGSLTIAGSGLTLGATTVVSETTAEVTVTTAADALPGPRDVTFTQSAQAGGASATGDDLVAVRYPLPTLSSVTPDDPRRGDSGTFTLTGSGFRTGGTVTTDNAGVTLSSPTFVSDSSFQVAYSIAAGAALGTADLTYAHAALGGGDAVTAADVYEVFSTGPVVTSVSPSALTPGEDNVTVVVAGSSFAAGISAAFSGSGLSVNSVTVDSGSQLTLVVDVASNAALGARSLTLTPTSGPAVVTSNAVVVAPADPTVTGFSHATLARGASSVSVTVRGTNFRTGVTLTASGTGVTFSSVSVTDATTLTASATVTAGAALTARDLTVTHAAANGGGAGTLGGAFAVIAATPTFTSLHPTKLAVTGSGGPTRTFPIRITGTNFMSGATLTVSRSGGSGVTVVANSVQVLSATSVAAELSLTGTATTGAWDLVVSNPSSLGTTGTGGNGALTINGASTLTVNRVLWTDDEEPHGGERVTIHGGGFATGDVVDFGARRGHRCQVIDANTLIVTVPQPASTSATAATAVDVKVTATGGSNATLTGGYVYAQDDVVPVTEVVVPAQGATGVPNSLVSACIRLTAPVNASTVNSGNTQGTHLRWFEGGASFVSNRVVGVGPQGRWIVFSRTGGGSLPIGNAGSYILETPVAVQSIAGTAFLPTRLSSTTSDQNSFTVTTSTDATAPTFTFAPANSATGVSTTAAIVITANEELDPLTVSATTVTFKQGATTVGAALVLGDDLKTITILPDTELAHSTSYTVAVTSGLRDLHGNGPSAASATFTTGSSTDGTAPTIDAVVIESLPSDLDGSTTYVTGNDSNSGGTAIGSTGTSAFDLLLPRSGFEVVVTFSDDGGSGIDPSTFSAKCNRTVGAASANTELAAKFSVTPTRAVWRIGSGDAIATGDNATFTFTVDDVAGNTSSASVITFDVLALTTTTNGNGGGDLDPFGTRDSWVLRTDLDAYTATFSTTTSPNRAGATTTATGNGIPDFEEALRLVGLNSASPTAAAKATVNGRDTGTNAIARRLVIERIREVVRERFGIDEDGTRDDDAVNIEFLLAGEQGALAALPTYATSQSSNANTPHNEMSLGGTDGAEASAFSASGTLGSAWHDPRNARKQINIDTGSGIVGVNLLGMMKLRVNDSGGAFADDVAANLVAIHGGTPVGEHASDDDILAATFDRSTSTNTTHNARYDALYDAIEAVAFYASAVIGHEVGHSLGLAPDGGPKTGLFGWAHRSNTFTTSTSGSPNTSAHLTRAAPRNLMSPTISSTAALATGSEFARFNPLFLANLLRRVLYDEGR